MSANTGTGLVIRRSPVESVSSPNTNRLPATSEDASQKGAHCRLFITRSGNGCTETSTIQEMLTRGPPSMGSSGLGAVAPDVVCSKKWDAADFLPPSLPALPWGCLTPRGLQSGNSGPGDCFFERNNPPGRCFS